jgi:hypothetical protein
VTIPFVTSSAPSKDTKIFNYRTAPFLGEQFWIMADLTIGKRKTSECVGCAHDPVIAKRITNYLNRSPEEVLEIQEALGKKAGGKSRAEDAWPGEAHMFFDLRRPEFRLRRIEVHDYDKPDESRTYVYDVRLWSLT